jgi:hypothetical protein
MAINHCRHAEKQIIEQRLGLTCRQGAIDESIETMRHSVTDFLHWNSALAGKRFMPPRAATTDPHSHGIGGQKHNSMPFFVAKERGFFREEGLEVELIVMQAIQTIQATLATAPNSHPLPAAPSAPP